MMQTPILSFKGWLHECRSDKSVMQMASNVLASC